MRKTPPNFSLRHTTTHPSQSIHLPSSLHPSLVNPSVYLTPRHTHPVQQRSVLLIECRPHHSCLPVSVGVGKGQPSQASGAQAVAFNRRGREGRKRDEGREGEGQKEAGKRGTGQRPEMTVSSVRKDSSAQKELVIVSDAVQTHWRDVSSEFTHRVWKRSAQRKNFIQRHEIILVTRTW